MRDSVSPMRAEWPVTASPAVVGRTGVSFADPHVVALTRHGGPRIPSAGIGGSHSHA